MQELMEVGIIADTSHGLYPHQLFVQRKIE